MYEALPYVFLWIVSGVMHLALAAAIVHWRDNEGNKS